MKIERLDGHDRSNFDCGVPDLNEWLQKQASQQQKRGNSVTFVGVHPEEGRVVGYYSSLAYRLDLDEVAAAYGTGRRRYPMPAVLLARLAVCESYRGRRAGEALLVHALHGAIDVADSIGVEVLVVHAINKDAAAFYGRYGFTQFADHELHLFMPMRAIRALLR